MFGLKRIAACLVATLLLFSAAAEAQVSVRGYFRSDGTYVYPHYRSAPDGDISNNWSTKGNVNPYTGEGGTRVSPRTRYGRRRVASSTHRADSLSFDERGRIRKAEELNRLGYNVDWGEYSYGELIDMASRIRKAHDLEQLGHPVDWQRFSYSDMIGMASRIRRARQLAQLGYDVDWRRHSYYQLIEMGNAARQRQYAR